MTSKQRGRSTKALARLEKQLKSGKKTAKKSFNKVELSEKDVKRVNKEISILENKLK